MKKENYAALADELQVAIFNPHYAAVPKGIIDSLCRYALDGTETGNFLLAVLSNDLLQAVGRADPHSFASLREIITFVNQELPAACWGSREKVAAWIWARKEGAGETDGGGYEDRDPPRLPMKGELG